jgi:tripartite-type tricarboxylate transporter receptor subunit TctC
VGRTPYWRKRRLPAEAVVDRCSCYGESFGAEKILLELQSAGGEIRMSLLRLILVLSLTAPYAADAQTFPTKPVRFIVPAAPGGPQDVVARIIAQKVGEGWGQQMLIDNRPGAGGIIASELGAKSPPDGYTWLMNISAFTTNPFLYRKLPYDTQKDFAPVTLLVSFPLVLSVHPSLPAKSVKELVALAKARPGDLNYGSPGVGTSPHLAMELFRTLANIKLTHVPYKSGPAPTHAILAGEISFYFNSIQTPLPYIRNGRLRAIGLSGTKRDPLLPDVPTIAESGFPAYEVIAWLGLLLPADTPPDIVNKANADVARALRQPDTKQRLANEGMEPVGNSPREFGAFLNSELKKWGKVVAEAGVKIEN